MTDLMIEATEVTKSFGTVKALDGVSIQVPKGTVLGLLGHNGAGKTTLVNILTTLMSPTSGHATVAGLDVMRHGDQVRSRIGLTGQFAAVDENLSGVDNLVLIARLLGASRKQAKDRAGELLATFDLSEAATRLAKTYSGGMRRRLDLAASLVGRPDVIFLDEPTTGLDPLSRIGLWEIVEGLVGDGTTVLLTTQYLEEADRLADSITVLSKGRVVAAGTAAQLKAEVGQRTVSVVLANPDDAVTALDALSRAGLHPMHDRSRNSIASPVAKSTDLATVVRALDEAGVEVGELALSEPTLDDVYLAVNSEAPAA
ncbi:daunorubicin resistance protein DrrA family ABC transporter ATP-binding protein [Kutzneria viridogrisea]|uniref:Daunorubicin/doxorubicin resistance ATP-binding protein DrrA n=2 Tax=Kutzneria TaxID=43356 RepID=W5W1Y2_9PSEU|nr:daunorubicin resistance protein DrrA family ABC transporter ATP-binding protein [Kutzneria albida]AHH94867.1 Daunorubicin/doxorubicin resistance ATP-binding protein DrrA [Kutzneria albida DSM 43870]MBA8927789.1 ABC-2 type transport system ATP-binding protein [Kutzneria viridogrisea]